MAEQVNRRIEDTINELEQMRRTNLYDDEEIREISRKRTEFEYRIQRRVKGKEDFVHYITYEMTLLEDIALRRKQNMVTEKKKDIEYKIAKRINKVFKQFIMRFQNDVEIYFQYIKFCKSVGFDHSVSTIIGEMLQIHGDKPKMWLMASKCEKDTENARQFLLKGIHRHPESEILYLELVKIELTLAHKSEDVEEKEKILKRASVVWKNGLKNIDSLPFLFELCNITSVDDTAKFIYEEIKQEIWSRNDNKEVWSYIAGKELEGFHWEQIDQFVTEDESHSTSMNNFICIYEEALAKFPDENLCTKYIHNLLSASSTLCTDDQRIEAVKRAWRFGHSKGLLTNDMYTFGIEFLKLEEMPMEHITQIIDEALKRNPRATFLWKEKIMLNKSDENEMLSIVQEANKVTGRDDVLQLWNLLLDNVESKAMLNEIYKRVQNCDSFILLALKPKLLQKSYNCNGLKAARDMYDEFIKLPPTQLEVHTVIIDIEMSQEKPNLKNIRKYYELSVQQYGKENVDIWTNYLNFETNKGNAKFAPIIYRRAVASLKKELVDDFIKTQTLAKIN